MTDTNTTPPALPDHLKRLKTMAEELERTIHADLPLNDRLDRQAQILDHILASMIKDEFSDFEYNKYRQEYGFPHYEIKKILTVQKQCADTIRICGSLRYMDAMIEKEREATPLPPKHDKRTE